MESGERVLLIDGDLRRPSVSRWFGIEAKVGLTQVLRGDATLAEALVALRRPRGLRPTENGSARGASPNDLSLRGVLDVLAHGELLDNPAPLLAGPSTAAVLATLSKHYDIVIIDTAPMLAVADTVPLLGLVDGALVVARVGVTNRDAAERLNDVVGRVPHANFLGVVANDVRDTFLEGTYGGMYASGRYGYGDRNGNGTGLPPRRRRRVNVR
jgi:Mrp family chromosome partitioning ATPase